MALQVQHPGTWSRILRLDWNVKRDGHSLAHAYCIYELNDKLYAYDSQGGQRVLPVDITAKYHVDEIGRYLGKQYFRTAYYLPAFDPPRSVASQ